MEKSSVSTWKILESLYAVMKNRKDKNVRFETLTTIGKKLVPNYRFKWPQMEWWEDTNFNKYLTLFDETEGMNADRRWMIYQLTRLTDSVPGDTAECGVYKGLGSYLICAANTKSQNHDRTHHMFDSFEGLSEPNKIDGNFWKKGDLSIGLEDVKKKFEDFTNVQYWKGWIPDRFNEVKDKQFSLIHIDVDIYKPTFDSIAFFYPRMSDGGIIICDDYGFTTCPGATEAINTFLADKPEKMISLSGGGGFIIKGKPTTRLT